jgi:hypothetical protein
VRPGPGPSWRRRTTEPRLYYWSAWFDGLQVTGDDHGRTTIAGPVTDQAALHGLLNKVRDLGLELLEVRRTDLDRQPGPDPHA